LYNLLIRFIIESYMELTLGTFLNMSRLNYDGAGEIASSILTFVFSAILIPLPYFLYFFTKKYAFVLGKKDFKTRFGSFYSEIDIRDPRNSKYIIFFLVRRLSISFSAVFLSEYFIIQIYIILLFSMFSLIFVTSNLPFKIREINNLEIFNELCVYINIVALLVLSTMNNEYVEDFN